jgi:hypothetical protein
LERIMGIDEEGDAMMVRFTGIHLTRAVGEALHRAYEGDLQIDYNDRDGQVRVYWQR